MMFGIFGGKPKDSPPTSVAEAKKLIERFGELRAGEIIRSAAMSGNLFCQIFLSQAGLFIPAEKRTEKIQRDVELFTEMAAKAGHADSQFNLAKLYMAKIDAGAEYLSQDDITNIKNARHWYWMAAKQGSIEAEQTALGLERVFSFL